MQWFFEDGATAFARAAQSSDTALMKLLLKYGADPKIATANGDTAIDARPRASDGSKASPTSARARKTSKRSGCCWIWASTRTRANNEGRTPLMGAALKGRNDVVQLLVDRGARLDTRDRGSRDTDKDRLGRGGTHVAGD